MKLYLLAAAASVLTLAACAPAETPAPVVEPPADEEPVAEPVAEAPAQTIVDIAAGATLHLVAGEDFGGVSGVFGEGGGAGGDAGDEFGGVSAEGFGF